MTADLPTPVPSDLPLGHSFPFRKRCGWCGVQLRRWQRDLCRLCGRKVRRDSTGPIVGLLSPPCPEGSRWNAPADGKDAS